MSRGNYFCTACGLCTHHHDGPICLSDEGFECSWDPIGFDLTTVVRTAGGGSHIPKTVDGTTCPYCDWDRPIVIHMNKPPMSFIEGMWERAKTSQMPR